VLGAGASGHVGILGQLARDAGAALAPPPVARWRLGVRLLPARRWHRGIIRRLRRSTTLSFEFGDTSVLRLHKRQQFVDTLVPGGDLRHKLIDPPKQATPPDRCYLALGESFFLSGMESVNQFTAVRSTP